MSTEDRPRTLSIAKPAKQGCAVTGVRSLHSLHSQRDITEREFMASVVELAEWLGWRRYHTHDSRHSAAGFPDLVLVKPPRVVFVELKTAKGKATRPQHEWLLLLTSCPGVETYLWRPSDWPTIEETLR